MKIDYYSFGKIVINGKTYSRDVIIFPDRVFSPGWRKEGQLVRMEDRADAVKEKPGGLVIGQGFSGLMSVPRELVDELRSMGMEVLTSGTTEAVNTFNKLAGKSVIAALHLTC